MKHFFPILLILIVYSCKNNQQAESTEQHKINDTSVQKKIKPELQQAIDSSNVKGSILIFDPQNNTYYSNDFQWAENGHLPASTFKITNSIIALETGVVENDSTLFKWNGKKRRLAIWEKDMIFKEAFHLSCVPCYQEVARKIGANRMNDFLVRFDYGNMTVDSSNIDKFWLEGESKITQFQQIDFLYRFYYNKLSISSRTEDIVKRMMVIDKNKTYTLSGKTGWSIRNGNNNGWFVGYIETKGNVYYFATNVEPKESFNMDMFPQIRNTITLNAFKRINLLNTTRK